MYIDIIPNRNSAPAVLLRESHRQGGKIVKKTVANLSKLPPKAIEVLRLALKGTELVPKESFYAIERSTPCGHVQALLGMARKLDLSSLVSSRPCRERDLVIAMVVQRLLTPCSKLATPRLWKMTTLARDLGVQGADENDLYAALDWLLQRQGHIEQRLAARHLGEGSRVLYDVSSSTYYGLTCPLAARGHNRDEQGELCIVYGLMTDPEGRPLAVQVYPGNTGDPATVLDQVEKLRTQYGLERVVLIGDRGMLTQARIEALRDFPNLGWISALRSSAIRRLVQEGAVQMSLFDEQNLAEIRSEEFPGERLVVCYNPLLAEERRRTRNELLDATEKELKRIEVEVSRRTKKPMGADQIGLKVGKVINRYKAGKHFKLSIQDNHFSFARYEDRIAEEEALDGIYVIRTSEQPSDLSAADAVRSYKSLERVEQAFRCLKGLDIRIRPIHHRTEERVQAHIFVCMLAYYVEWHMRQALAPVLFQDEELHDSRWTRDPVAKAEPSQSTLDKKRAHVTPDGWPVHSFETLLEDLATRTMNVCRVGEGEEAVRFEQYTELTSFQQHVFELLGLKP